MRHCDEAKKQVRWHSDVDLYLSLSSLPSNSSLHAAVFVIRAHNYSLTCGCFVRTCTLCQSREKRPVFT
ncbi:hypothetical protein AcW1_009630 [Taiwanofungus camphoratus]|nr:hypothetical protein AcW1_009630 [Antrodia cinnamomea]